MKKLNLFLINMYMHAYIDRLTGNKIHLVYHWYLTCCQRGPPIVSIYKSIFRDILFKRPPPRVIDINNSKSKFIFRQILIRSFSHQYSLLVLFMICTYNILKVCRVARQSSAKQSKALHLYIHSVHGE